MNAPVTQNHQPSPQVTANVPAAPTQRDLAQAFKSQLSHNEAEFKMALPAHIPVERFMRVVTTAVVNNPDLLMADRRSLFESATKAAQDGLLPDGRDGALVIYNTKIKEGGKDVWVKKIQWMPMIGGVLKKIRNSGELLSISAYVAFENDEFIYELGDDERIVHKPALENRGNPRLAYAIARTKDGGIYREIVTMADVEKVRNVSRAKDRGPWVDWFEEMCRKTVLRRLAKRLPMSSDLDDLIRRDDALYDLDGAREQQRANLAGASTLSGRLDALAAPATPAHDAETGEIIDQSETGAPEAHPTAPQAAAAPAERDLPQTEPAAVDQSESAADRLLAEARREAINGRKAFDRWYRAIEDHERDMLNGHMRELLAAAAAADGSEAPGDASEELPAHSAAESPRDLETKARRFR